MIDLRRYFAATLIFVAGFAAPTQAQPAYRLTDLGTFAGGSISSAAAINNLGQVTGFANGTPSAGFHGFLSNNGGPLQDIGSLPFVGFPATFGRAINAAGQIVGDSRRDDMTGSFNHAFLFSGGALQDLGTLPGQTRSIATGVNAAAQVVGYSYSEGPFQNTTTRAFLYAGGTLTDIGTLGGSNAFAYAINDAGQATGTSRTPEAYSHAFRYQNGVMQNLGTFAEPPGSPPPPPFQGTTSVGRAINAAGVVAGSSQLNTFTNLSHAARFDGVTVADLGTLGGDNSDASALNNFGAIVGSSQVLVPGSTVQAAHAFLFDTTMRDLNGLIDVSGTGWTVQYAYGINDRGQIVGQGVNPAGELHAYLLTPVPEPGSLALAGGVGLAALAWRRRFGQRASGGR